MAIVAFPYSLAAGSQNYNAVANATNEDGANVVIDTNTGLLYSTNPLYGNQYRGEPLQPLPGTSGGAQAKYDGPASSLKMLSAGYTPMSGYFVNGSAAGGDALSNVWVDPKTQNYYLDPSASSFFGGLQKGTDPNTGGILLGQGDAAVGQINQAATAGAKASHYGSGGDFLDSVAPALLQFASLAGGLSGPAGAMFNSVASDALGTAAAGSSALQSVYGVGAGGFGAPLTAYQSAMPVSAGIDAAAAGGIGSLTGTAGATALSDAATLGSNMAGTPTAGSVTPGVQSFTSPPVTPQVGGYSTNVPSTDFSLGGTGPGYTGAGGSPTGVGLEATTAGGGALTTGVAGAAGTTAAPGTIATAGAELGGLSGSTGVFDQFINYVSNLTPSSAANDIKSASDLAKLGSSVVGIGSGINSIVNPGISPTAAQNMTDPFASSRQQYIDQLNAVMANPSLTMSQPGYQFQYQQGLQGLDRSLAQRGMGTSTPGQPGTPASGGAGIAQQKYGQEYALSSYNNYVNRLAGLAGATQQPAQGGQAALTAQQAAQKQAQAGWGALTQGAGTLSTYFGGPQTGGTQTTGMTSPVGGYSNWQNVDMGSQNVPAYNLPNVPDWTGI